MSEKEIQIEISLLILNWKLLILQESELQFKYLNKLKYMFEKYNDDIYEELNNFMFNFPMISKLWDFLFQNNLYKFKDFNAILYNERSNLSPLDKYNLTKMLEEFLNIIKYKMFSILYDNLLK